LFNVLLVAEGPTDAGREIYNEKKGKKEQSDGPIQIFIRRIMDDCSFAFTVRRPVDVKNFPLLRKGKYISPEDPVNEKLPGMAGRLCCDHIAYHQDVDANEFEIVYAKVRAHFINAENEDIPCLAIIPKRMIESWLLADTSLFGVDFTLPKPPEELWGKEKAGGNHPKDIMGMALAGLHKSDITEAFAELAWEADISVLLKKCPISFYTFYCDLLLWAAR